MYSNVQDLGSSGIGEDLCRQTLTECRLCRAWLLWLLKRVTLLVGLMGHDGHVLVMDFKPWS